MIDSQELSGRYRSGHNSVVRSPLSHKRNPQADIEDESAMVNVYVDTPDDGSPIGLHAVQRQSHGSMGRSSLITSGVGRERAKHEISNRERRSPESFHPPRAQQIDSREEFNVEVTEHD